MYVQGLWTSYYKHITWDSLISSNKLISFSQIDAEPNTPAVHILVNLSPANELQKPKQEFN